MLSTLFSQAVTVLCTQQPLPPTYSMYIQRDADTDTDTDVDVEVDVDVHSGRYGYRYA